MELHYDTLIGHAQNGDTDAFAQAYSMVYEDLYRYAFYSLGSKADAEDAVQDAAIEAFKCIKNLKNPQAFRAWIYAILVRTCKKRIKERIKSRELQNQQQSAPFLTDDFDDRLLEADRLRNAILLLPAAERLVLLLAVKGGYNSTEIGKMLKIPAGSVRSRLSRSYGKLKDLIKEDNQL